MIRLAPLLALAATLAAVLALELVDPVLPDAPVVPHAVPPRAAAKADGAAADPAEELDDLVETLLGRPPLIPARRGAMLPAAAVAAETAEELPRLAGVLVGPDGRRAIFALAAGRAEVKREGESIGRFTITSIAPNAVTLKGSEGDRLIHPSHAKPASAARPAGARP